MTSGLTDETFFSIKEQPALCAWLERMQRKFSTYPRLYSQRLVDSSQEPQRATRRERIVFYTALVIAVVLFPVTMVWLMDAFLRRNKNPHRSGGRLG